MTDTERVETVHEAVAAVVSSIDGSPHLLVFDHPSAGTRLVKATVEEGETIEAAVIRELYAESGLVVESAGSLIDRWDASSLADSTSPDRWPT